MPHRASSFETLKMKAQEISTVICARLVSLAQPDADILHLLTDSRRLADPQNTLFFAIPTSRNTGCRYIENLYHRGVRSFVVPYPYKVDYPDVNLWQVDDVVLALQQIASHHRQQFHIPVIGITGSNGKTIVKDWLVQLLSPDHHVAASPKSYNSQIGVPLSLWQINASHDLAVIEAGISQPGEMQALTRIIKPTIGILTNIGAAHDEGFLSREQKTEEKLRLFVDSDVLICNEQYATSKAYTWGSSTSSNVRLLSTQLTANTATFTISTPSISDPFTVTIPFADRASCENAMHCITLMLYLGYAPAQIADRCACLAPVSMRLELLDGINNTLLINDSYSLDIASLDIALDTLANQHRHPRHTLIISDIPQSGIPEQQLYTQLASLLQSRHVDRLIAIGPALLRQQNLFSQIEATFFSSTEHFLLQLQPNTFHDETILLKGARAFHFEGIATRLRQKSHQTLLEVNIDALIHNLNYYRNKLKPTTRLMAMVKANAYGAGLLPVATALQNNHVDYLTVAYIDEGVELRRGGVTLPIMIMNPEPAGFDDIVRYQLEPDIYSLHILNLFAEHLKNNQPSTMPFPIHIEFDTGMHRLGFTGADLPQLTARLAELAPLLQVRSVFSHLACSEDFDMDEYTRLQIDRLRQWSANLPGIKHILNSSGITRFPDAQMDMVRLGIGLYGVSPDADEQARLHAVSRLVSRISQIKDIPAGDTVGYNCRWTATRPSRIAILTLGYADGLNHHLGNNRGRILINGKLAPIIGSICMDMCFVDVTDVPCAEGDRAVIFGEGDLLQRNAQAAGTIPYELLTAVAPRVKRVYYHEE